MTDVSGRMVCTDAPAKTATYAAGAALLIAVLAPLRQNWRRRPRDGFPLSYYPMFSARRERTGTVVHLVGVNAAGQPQILHYRHAGSGGLNQVRRQLRRTVKAGHAQEVAQRAAASVLRSSRSSEVGIAEVRVVSSRHVYDTFFAGDRVPEKETVHATAPVDRTST
jgi:hypothetical protein